MLNVLVFYTMIHWYAQEMELVQVLMYAIAFKDT
jgi:hypothetical protein